MGNIQDDGGVYEGVFSYDPQKNQLTRIGDFEQSQKQSIMGKLNYKPIARSSCSLLVYSPKIPSWVFRKSHVTDPSEDQITIDALKNELGAEKYLREVSAELGQRISAFRLVGSTRNIATTECKLKENHFNTLRNLEGLDNESIPLALLSFGYEQGYNPIQNNPIAN